MVAGFLTDCVLADAILIFPAHRLKEGKGFTKKVRKQVTENEKGDVGMAKRFSKKYGNKG